jgi:hypothetical protein
MHNHVVDLPALMGVERRQDFSAGCLATIDGDQIMSKPVILITGTLTS